MKKFLNIFFAAVLIIVSAQSLYAAADFKFNGEYRVRGFNYNTVTGVGQGGDGSNYIDQRFLLTGTVTQGITTGLVEMGLLTNSLGGNTQEGYIWGTGNGATPGQNLSHGGIHQAYLNMTFPLANLMAGRRIIGLGHGLILNETADNLALSVPLQILTLDLAYLKLTEADFGVTSTTGRDHDKNGYLINVGIKPTDAIKGGLFYIKTVTSGTATTDVSNTALGITADGQAGPLGFLVEYDNLGGDTLVSGSSFKGQNILVGVNGDVSVAKVGLSYLRVTGADKCGSLSVQQSIQQSPVGCDQSLNSIAGDYVGGHGILLTDQTRYAGGVNLQSSFMDSATNLRTVETTTSFSTIKLSAEAMLIADLNVGVEIYPYLQLVDSDTAGNSNIGQEYNIYGGYRIDKNLTLNAVVAFLNAGDVLKDADKAAGGGGNATNIQKYMAGLTYIF